jgi:hypothetical protein
MKYLLIPAYLFIFILKIQGFKGILVMLKTRVPVVEFILKVLKKTGMVSICTE